MAFREYFVLCAALAIGAMIFASPKQPDSPLAIAARPTRQAATSEIFPTFPMSDFSARGCVAWANSDPDKALRPALEQTCMIQEQGEMEGLLPILRDIPEDTLKQCLLSVQQRPASSQRTAVIVDCLDNALNSMPAESLPRGTAMLYVGSLGHRYWSLADCQRRRQPGGVCINR